MCACLAYFCNKTMRAHGVFVGWWWWWWVPCSEGCTCCYPIQRATARPRQISRDLRDQNTNCESGSTDRVRDITSAIAHIIDPPHVCGRAVVRMGAGRGEEEICTMMIGWLVCRGGETAAVRCTHTHTDAHSRLCSPIPRRTRETRIQFVAIRRSSETTTK